MRRRPAQSPGLFRPHALMRFRTRRPDLFLPCRTGPTDGDVLWRAKDSYFGGRMISRQEARAIIGGGLRQWWQGQYIFRMSGDGRGIWMARFTGGHERVLTYIIRRTRCRTWPCRIPLLRRRACA